MFNNVLIFPNKSCDVLILDYGVNNEILSPDLNYIVDPVM